MKKIFILLSLGAMSFSSFGQSTIWGNAHTALNFSQTDPIMGTARYSGMAGAMGALGADPSAMKDNPAGLGVYRSGDISFTPNVYIDNDNSVGFNVNNFSVIFNFPNSGKTSGYVTSSFGIGYNRLKNFKRHTELGFKDFSQLYPIEWWSSNIDSDSSLIKDATKLGLFDENGNSLFSGIDEEIDNQIIYTEDGSLAEWNFSYGANISNKVYVGASIGVVNLDYNLTATYNERNDGGNTWGLINVYNAEGSGANFKFGAIYTPADFMRIGFAFHTPTFMSINSEWLPDDIYHDGEYAVPNNDDKWEWDAEYVKFKLQTPLKLQGSLGFILGKRALIGLEYQFSNYQAMRTSGNNGLYRNEKNFISDQMTSSHTAKVGTEINIVKGLSARAGFAFVSSPVNDLTTTQFEATDGSNFQTYPLVQPKNTFYYTAGIGYRGKSFYADLAYVHQVRNEHFFEFMPINATSPIDLSLVNNNIMATLGFRF
jgi:hypothetical protein